MMMMMMIMMMMMMMSGILRTKISRATAVQFQVLLFLCSGGGFREDVVERLPTD